MKDIHKDKKSLEEKHWKSLPKRVTVPYSKEFFYPECILSTTEHEKLCGKPGGPPSKAKYSMVTDSEKYREGKMKRTPGGE